MEICCSLHCDLWSDHSDRPLILGFFILWFNNKIVHTNPLQCQQNRLWQEIVILKFRSVRFVWQTHSHQHECVTQNRSDNIGVCVCVCAFVVNVFTACVFDTWAHARKTRIRTGSRSTKLQAKCRQRHRDTILMCGSFKTKPREYERKLFMWLRCDDAWSS